MTRAFDLPASPPVVCGALSDLRAIAHLEPTAPAQSHHVVFGAGDRVAYLQECRRSNVDGADRRGCAPRPAVRAAGAAEDASGPADASAAATPAAGRAPCARSTTLTAPSACRTRRPAPKSNTKPSSNVIRLELYRQVNAQYTMFLHFISLPPKEISMVRTRFESDLHYWAHY